MRMKSKPSTSLAPVEKVRVAFAHICLGVDQHTLASMYGINPGRVSEAVKAVREAVKNIEEETADD